MKNLITRLSDDEPVAIGAALQAVLNALVLLHVVVLNAEQLAGVNVAFVSVVALLVRPRVTPNTRL
jgi:hypothetical protein